MKSYVGIGVFVTIAILAVAFLTKSCGNSTNFHRSRTDTVFTWVRYFDSINPQGNHRTAEGMCIRIALDSMKLLRADTNSNGTITQDKKWMRDTIYYAPYDLTEKIPTPKDSTDTAILRHKERWSGVAKVRKFVLLPNNWLIQDYNITEDKLFPRK